MTEYKDLLMNKMKIACPYNEFPDKNRNKIRKQWELDDIKKYSKYDYDKFWKYIIKNNEPGDIRTFFHLDYIFSENNIDCQDVLEDKRVCVIAHINYPDLIGECMEYIKKIPKTIDIIITTKGESNIKKLQDCITRINRSNIRIIVPKNRGREISALLVACRDEVIKYDYLCFVHDKKKNGGESFETVGKAFMDILWENSIINDKYIKNVLNKFDEEPYLGLLAPPTPYMSSFFSVCATSWTSNYEKTIELARNLSLNCVLDENKNPFILGTTFWCRVDALRPLFEWKFKYEDFEPEPMKIEGTINHAIERIFPYVAQSQGYYSGIMMAEKYASIYLENYKYMIKEIIEQCIQPNSSIRFDQIKKRNQYISEKSKKFKYVYIYGAGIEAKSYIKSLTDKKQINGIIVSDGYKKDEFLEGIPIYEINEIEPCNEELIIVALNSQNRKAIMPNLRNRGFKNIVRYR